jgi:hypothetical protein
VQETAAVCVKETPAAAEERKRGGAVVQGYLARKKTPPLRTLQKAFASGPTVVLGGGRFILGEVLIQSTQSVTYRARPYEATPRASGEGGWWRVPWGTGVPRS